MNDYNRGERFDRNEPKSGAGKFVFIILLLFVGGVGYLAYAMMGSGAPDTPTPSVVTDTPVEKPTGPKPDNPGGHTYDYNGQTTAPRIPQGKKVAINVAYGTEKKLWLKWAVDEWEKTPAGARIKVNLHGRGSVEGAHAVLNGPGDVPFHVWSPASSAYRDVFETEWKIKHGNEPIVRSEDLALSPMVYVMWKERYDAYATKYKSPSFKTLSDAMHAPGGWSEIANKPDWGLFKFAHTHPNQSNSGLLTLVLMAYDYHDKHSNLSLGDITNADFQQWLQKFERAVAKPGGSLEHSTGTLMRSMVLRGPSYYDGVMVYENLAIDYLKAAQGRWGELHVVYPERNMWNENPFYILDVPWSKKEHRAAAAEFLDFLMSEPIQRKALDHGFRPGNPVVPIKFPESPFVRYEKYGIRVDIATVCEPPKAEVLNNLIASFERIAR